MSKNSNAWFALIILSAINLTNFFDRLIIGAVAEPIRLEFALSDTSLGLLATAFTLIYAVVGVPFGRLADKFSRKHIVAGGVFIWSLLTAASGFAQSYAQIFAIRLGVGVGEASFAPAATSLIGDLFPAEKRARAMSIFMLGLPIGIAMSFFISGSVAKAYGWRAAFFVAGIPGLVLAFAYLLKKVPLKEAAGVVPKVESVRSPFRTVLSSKVMLWIIASGALHNFSLYALSSFITPYLMRYFELDIRNANIAAMVINGVLTLPGLLLGGYLGDLVKGTRKNGALILVALTSLASAPFFFLAVNADRTSVNLFLITMGIGFMLMYFYYAIVYSTIQDITPVNLRGTAMSIYFMAMYILGGALGPLSIGLLSDHFTRKAASIAGIVELTSVSLEPFRAQGLRTAMYIVPVISLLLAFVMWMAARHLSRSQPETSMIDG
jgi:MFS family permease